MQSRTIAIVGAGSAIARDLASRLETDGHTVLRWSRGGGGGATPVESYVDELDVVPETLDGLAYFPGTLKLAPFHRISLEAFRADWEVNVGGFINAVQRMLPALQKGSAPSVVAVSSVAVQTGLSFHATVGQAKGALEGLVRSLAAEYAAKGIRFNAVAPSLTESALTASFVNSHEKRERMNQRHPLGRFGQPGDIAEAMRFLLGAGSSWITGQVLGVDGGFGATRP